MSSYNQSRAKFILRLSVCACFIVSLASCGLDFSSEPENPKVIADTSSSEVSKPVTPAQNANKEQTRVVATKNLPRPSLVGINSLGLAPIQVSSSEASTRVGEADLDKIQDELQAAFKAYTSTDVVALRELKGISKGALAGDTNSLLALTKAKGIDGLLLVDLQAYSKRSGSSIGTDQGAEFGVLLQVIETDSGKVAWEGSYYEQDKAAPLVSVSGGELRNPKFRSVESLIKEAFAKLGTDYSEARLKTYLVK